MRKISTQGGAVSILLKARIPVLRVNGVSDLPSWRPSRSRIRAVSAAGLNRCGALPAPRPAFSSAAGAGSARHGRRYRVCGHPCHRDPAAFPDLLIEPRACGSRFKAAPFALGRSRTRQPRPEMRDYLFAEEANGLEHFFVLCGPDRA